MNHSDERLSKAFRDLAAERPQGAPSELGNLLKDSFRKHHARRRRIRAYSGISAIAACIILAIIFISSRHTGSQERPADNGTLATDHQITQPKQVVPQQPVDKPSTPDSAVTTNKRHPKTNGGPIAGRPKGIANIARDFTPLPTYDPAIPTTGYQIVRVGLQDTALSQLGLPVHESSAGKRIVADLLLDKDGMPMAVRFVGNQKTQ